MRFKTNIVSILLITGVLLSVTDFRAQAAISSCSADVTPHSVAPNSETEFQFQITNTAGNSIRWIRISRPSINFSIFGFTANGWIADSFEDSVTLYSGMLNPGATMAVQVQARATNVQAPPANWIVQASDDTNGANPTSCNGNLSTEIAGELADTTPPTISSISISSLTTTSVVISWITDEPATSYVIYGPTDDYDFDVPEDTSLVTQHSIQLSGLTPDSAYHYMVRNSDAAGNTSDSLDNTFLTPLAQTASLLPSPTPSLESTPESTPGPAGEKPPTVTITTNLNQPFQEAPTVSGRATGERAITRVDYSLDNGRNWLPVDSPRGLGSRSVTFAFRPLVFDDGNYLLLARAIDTVGARGVSQPVTLIIDRLPPIVGGNMISIGPQVLQPDENGTLHSLAKIDQKITLSAGGGPVSITLVATLIPGRTGGQANADAKIPQLFTLTRSAQTGLWSGILSFQNSGQYTLVADAIDGAGKRTERTLNAVSVAPLGTLVEKNTDQPIPQASVTLYYLAPDTNTWTVWDGGSFGQDNPQTTDEAGQFSYLVPPGTYYLQARAAGFRTATSSIFTLDSPTPLSTELPIPKIFAISLGGVDLNLPVSVGSAMAYALVDTPLPSFRLPNLAGEPIESESLKGQATLLTLFSTWSPAAREQLPILQTLQQDDAVRVLPTAVLEKVAKVNAYTRIARYNLDLLVDAEGSIVESFHLQSLPTHYFVNSAGVIKEVVVGVLSGQELREQLAGL